MEKYEPQTIQYLERFCSANIFISQFTKIFPAKISIVNTESFKGFEMKPLWVFSYSPRDKNFRGFPYE